MATGSLDNAAIRERTDDMQDYLPADANIFEGAAVVFDNTSGDNRSIVLPNHANALLGGRAFAGISAVSGSPTLAQDKSWATQRDGIAICALLNSTACTRGQIAGYDPADGGYIKPYVSGKMVPIGRFQQTLSSGTSQRVGVRLNQIGRSINLVGAITASSTALGADAETLLDQSVTIGAAQLQVGDVVHITGKCRVTVGADTETLVLTLYWGGLTGLALCASPGTPNPAANDVWVFDIWATVRSATTIDLFGIQTNIAAPGTAAPVAVGAAGAQTIGNISGSAVIGVSQNWSAATDDRVAIESLIVHHLPQTA